MSQEYKTITLAAGESRAINTPGKVFVCDTSTGSFKLRAGNQAEADCSSKRVFGSSTSPRSDRFEVRNTSGANNTIIYAIADQDIWLESITTVSNLNLTTSGKNAPTYTLGTAAIANVTRSGIDGGGQLRKQIIVQNRGSAEVEVQAANFVSGFVIASGDPAFTMECGGDVKIIFNGAGTKDARIIEVFYT